MHPLRVLMTSLALLPLATAAPAAAAERTEAFRTGPLTVAGYQVLQEQAMGGLRKSSGNGFVTHMKVDVMDRRGAPIQWRFSLHDVTPAWGPRGFSSPHLDRGRTYRSKPSTPGTYRLLRSLHPVAMTQSIVVR